MARPIVEWRLAESLARVVPLALVLAQCLYAALASHRIEPGARQDRAHGVDAVLHTERCHNDEPGLAGPQQCLQHVKPRFAGAEFTHLRVMRQDMARIAIWLLAENLCVMRKRLAG